MTKIEKKFKQPDPGYRSAPFWSWNEALNEKCLKQQLEEMKKGGMAGGFMHSRVGLITPYLSKEWMESVRNTVKYAKKLAIPIYLYDEDRWPSGFAGGLVTRNRKYAMKWLKMSQKADQWKFETSTIPPSAYFNNAGYLDTLSQEAVKKFIDSTYVAYQKVVGSEFGRTIPAIFTDEPNYLMGWGLVEGGAFSTLPWTGGLDKIFKQLYGYDLKKNFIYLVENKGDYQKVRYHFFRLVTELFTENFGRQIHDWCEENNIALTGHYLAEDTLASQVQALGAAMPLYEYMQMPGVDHLGRQLPSAYLTIKQCSSVAHQLGKKRVLSELFGCSGQNMTFTDRKWIGNWNTVLGVNLFGPHLWLYSMAGGRKRDYPPTLSYQQPYWKYNRVIEDYFARINFLTNQGQFQADILVLHPIESAWCLYNPAHTQPVDRLNHKFVSLLQTLSGQHYDYDLGDESLMAKYGRVTSPSGQREALFKVGRMAYRLVIIPEIISLRETTIKLLNSFIDRGGKVIACEPLPERVEGRKDEKGLIKQLYSRLTLLPASSGRGANLARLLTSSLATVLKKEIFVTEAQSDREIEDIYYQHRRLNNHTDIYFLVNNNKERAYSTELKILSPEETILELWDPLSGDICTLNEVKQKEGYGLCHLHFPEAGSHILVKKKKRAGNASTKPALTYSAQPTLTNISSAPAEEIMRLPASSWVCRQKDPNSLTLDHCRYKTATMKRWSKPTYALDVQSILERKLKNKSSFSLRYTFQAKLKEKPNPIFLILERPEQYEIQVNKKKVSNQDSGSWLDTAFRKINITAYLRPEGKNTLELKGRFIHPTHPQTLIYVKGGTEVEAVYLVGNFNVEGKFKRRKEGLVGEGFRLGEEKEPRAADTVSSGYPFYAGSFLFFQELDFTPEGKRVFLSLDKLQVITLKVTLNGKEAGLILWPPYSLEITDFLKAGKNLIEIEITNSLRNLLGPHHQRDINPPSVGPYSFNDKNNWIDGYTFIPFGLGACRLFHADR